MCLGGYSQNGGHRMSPCRQLFSWVTFKPSNGSDKFWAFPQSGANHIFCGRVLRVKPRLSTKSPTGLFSEEVFFSSFGSYSCIAHYYYHYYSFLNIYPNVSFYCEHAFGSGHTHPHIQQCFSIKIVLSWFGFLFESRAVKLNNSTSLATTKEVSVNCSPWGL